MGRNPITMHANPLSRFAKDRASRMAALVTSLYAAIIIVAVTMVVRTLA